MNRGYAYSIAELKEAIRANTEFVTCPLTHVGVVPDYHKEPYLASVPGDRADSNTIRAIIHAKDPGGIHRTATVSEWEGLVPASDPDPCGGPAPPEGPGFVDHLGYTYNSAGLPVGTAPLPQAIVVIDYGYYFDIATGLHSVGVQVPPALIPPSYDDLVIGSTPPAAYTGYQGTQVSAYRTNPCRGLGVSAGKVLGYERLNDPAGDFTGSLTNWTINIRDVTTFAILATNAATYITDWFTSHAAGYASNPETLFPPHVSAYADGSFWISAPANVLGTPVISPVWNVSGVDGSMISLTEIQTVAADVVALRIVALPA